MAGRGFRVLYRDNPNLPFSVIVECNRINQSLLLESSAVLTLDENVEEQFLLVVTGVLSMGQLYNCEVYRITMVQFVSLKSASSEFIDPRITELQRLISSGIFYFATSVDQSQVFDLTLTAQKRMVKDTSDDRFFWNKNLHFPLETYGVSTSDWLLRVMCGTVQIRLVYIGCKTAKVAILSRLSCERVGTRFNVRGVNDYGHVANFVETEQIRGSVPLFWEQPGINVGSHKVKLRALEVSAAAYNRHFRFLKEEYGGVLIVDLLGSKEGERILTQAYKEQHRNSAHTEVSFIAFDYHAQIKMSKTAVDHLVRILKPALENFGFFYVEKDHVLRSQLGVLRINCLDCLDRTNAVQTIVGLQVLSSQLACLPSEARKPNIVSRFEELLKDLWQKNGDFCSIIYAGTGALEGKSKFKDAGRSLARTIQNNLMDSSKQESFDLFLHGSSYGAWMFGNAAEFLPPIFMHQLTHVVKTVMEREHEMMDEVLLTIFAGTWNVNGGKNMHNIAFRNQAPLSEWLFPNDLLVSIDATNFCADIVAIGLEELIDLNASNIMKASTTNQKLWCNGLMDALRKRGEYVLLGSEQLVGVCLFIFVKPYLLTLIRDFAFCSVKTGMGGAAGNKGSVSFRFSIYATSFCFVCSHFAAGQNEVRDRNEDYMSTLKKIHFPLGRNILSNDVVIWLGDFNYRINLSCEDAKKAVRAQMFQQLAKNDQLTQERAIGSVFHGFQEGPLNFAPTYKYDTFSDDYDTSEKCRVPAWTDRILFKSSGRGTLRLLRYGRSELKTSDHRPVSALFQATAWELNPEKFEKAYEDIVSSMGPPDATVLVAIAGASAFPTNLYYPILEKLVQLGITPLLSKFDGKDLWLVLGNGEMALVALSMDGLDLNGSVLQVRLRTPDWPELDILKIQNADRIDEAADTTITSNNGGYHIDYEDDDDDFGYLQNSSSSLSNRTLEEHFSLVSTDDVPFDKQEYGLFSRPQIPAHSTTDHLLSSHPSDPCMPKTNSLLEIPAPPRAASSLDFSSSYSNSSCAVQDAETLSNFDNVGTYTVRSVDTVPTIPPRPKIIFK